MRWGKPPSASAWKRGRTLSIAPVDVDLGESTAHARLQTEAPSPNSNATFRERPSRFPQKATCAVTPLADSEPSTAFPRNQAELEHVRDLESSLTAGVRPEPCRLRSRASWRPA